MKILHLFPYLPTPPNFGGALRVYHILRYLYENHDVTVAGFIDHGDLALFKTTFPDLRGKRYFQKRLRVKYPRLLQLYSFINGHSYWYNRTQSSAFERRINALLRKEPFDIVLSEFASMAHFDLQTKALRILDAHNVEYDNYRRMSALDWSGIRKRFYEREYRKSYHEEIGAFKQQDAIFVTSERDGQIIRRDVPHIPQFVIPNGVDTAYFSPSPGAVEPYSMVFTGAMGYVPNHDGMLYFLDEIFPLIQNEKPEAKVYIVGSNPPPVLQKRASDSIIITGFVDDVRPYIDRASVFVVPLNMGSGTRLKVVEALSMQKPVVSTRIGCEGIDVVDGQHLLVRDTPDAFAEATLKLFSNEELRQKLIDNGYKLVKNRYDWSVIGRSIEEAFQQLTAKNLHPTKKNVGVGYS